jgi:TatD DNase family protein
VIMAYLDSHAHLTDEAFAPDREAVIARALAAGVERMMLITLHPEETALAFDLQEKYPGRFTIAAGIFPDEADTVTASRKAAFEQLLQDPRIAAIGEIGLDYHWEKDPAVHGRQRELFCYQIDLARRLHKPILVHSRDAMQDTLDALKENPVPGLIHCFSGSVEMAREFVKRGYYIALGGAVTFKNSRRAQEVAADIDPRFLLSETDCPYMAPVPMRGKRNEPAFIPYIVAKLAELKGMAPERMAAQIDANWTRFLEGQ